MDLHETVHADYGDLLCVAIMHWVALGPAINNDNVQFSGNKFTVTELAPERMVD